MPCDKVLAHNSSSNCDNKIGIRASICLSGKGTDRCSASEDRTIDRYPSEISCKQDLGYRFVRS